MLITVLTTTCFLTCTCVCASLVCNKVFDSELVQDDIVKEIFVKLLSCVRSTSYVIQDYQPTPLPSSSSSFTKLNQIQVL